MELGEYRWVARWKWGKRPGISAYLGTYVFFEDPLFHIFHYHQKKKTKNIVLKMFMYEDIFICIFRNYQQIFPDLQHIVCIIKAFKIFNIQKLGNLGLLQNDSFWEVQFSMNFCVYIYLNVKIYFFILKMYSF